MEGRDRNLHEECGVFGIYAPGMDVARVSFFALYALQHRGQESAGIATSDGHLAYLHKGMGLVAQVFNEKNMRPLKGHMAIAHNRYSTTGTTSLRNAQPYLIETLHGPLGVAHNGNLTNASRLRLKLLQRGVGLVSGTDSEVITQMLAFPQNSNSWEERISAFMAEAEGAYSLTILTKDAVFGVRDPWGLRPLVIGNFPSGGWALASESCALSTIGAELVREVEPGEIVRLDANGVTSTQGQPVKEKALCIFEYVYFARPDSILGGQAVHLVRQRLGEELAREAPVDADIVIGVPDSSTPAAIGFANAIGLPFTEGLTKNRYIGRTFIQPDDRLRQMGVALKFNALDANLTGKRVIMVDDSIVRGTTAGPLVRLLRQAGAKEVHVRVSSPPVRYPCFMGVDMATQEELIAHRLDVEGIRKHIGADSLHYLSYEGLIRAVTAGASQPSSYCTACFSGRYPVPLDETWLRQRKSRKESFETVRE